MTEEISVSLYDLAREVGEEVKKLEGNKPLKNKMSNLVDQIFKFYCSYARNNNKIVDYQDQLRKIIYDNSLSEEYHNCEICKNKNIVRQFVDECELYNECYGNGKCVDFEKDTEKEKLLKKCEVDSFLFSLDNVDRIIWGTLRKENPEFDFTTLKGTDYIDLVNKIEYSEDKRRVLNFLKKHKHDTYIYFEKDTFTVSFTFGDRHNFDGYNFFVVDDARKPGLDKVKFLIKDHMCVIEKITTGENE